MPVRLKASLKVQRTRLQYAAWLGNTTSLVIVVDNDIYLKQSPSDEEDIRITNTGKPDLIYNGVPDWLYQGEYDFGLANISAGHPVPEGWVHVCILHSEIAMWFRSN